MPEQLEILEVRLGTPRPSTYSAEQQRVDVAIDVRNNSNSTLHLISSVRTLDYDPATRTLVVGLSESELPPDIKLHQFMAPHTATVEPKATSTINVSVPQIIRKMAPSAGKLGLGIEEVDISGVQQVRCNISYSTTPFYPRLTDPPEKIRRELSSWGQKTERVLPITLGGASGPSAPPPARNPRKGR